MPRPADSVFMSAGGAADCAGIFPAGGPGIRPGLSAGGTLDGSACHGISGRLPVPGGGSPLAAVCRACHDRSVFPDSSAPSGAGIGSQADWHFRLRLRPVLPLRRRHPGRKSAGGSQMDGRSVPDRGGGTDALRCAAASGHRSGVSEELCILGRQPVLRHGPSQHLRHTVDDQYGFLRRICPAERKTLGKNRAGCSDAPAVFRSVSHQRQNHHHSDMPAAGRHCLLRHPGPGLETVCAGGVGCCSGHGGSLRNVPGAVRMESEPADPAGGTVPDRCGRGARTRGTGIPRTGSRRTGGRRTESGGSDGVRAISGDAGK